MKLAVLISGRGTNLQALIDACARPEFPASIALVVSNRPDAAGLTRARDAGITTQVVDHTAYDSRDAFETALQSVLTSTPIDLLCLAGFMRILGSDFVSRWKDRMINIHPSLLPAYKGLHTHERVLEDGGRFAGCTLHYVRPEMDSGPIIAQAVVPVMPADTAETLGARILAQENRLYPVVVQLIAEGRVRVRGNRVEIDGVEAQDGQLFFPASA